MPASMYIVTRMLSGHGDAVVAGFNVASRVEMMAHMILWSATSSVEPFVGQNWGAGLVGRVRRALKLVNNFCLGWGVVTFLLMVAVGEHLVRLIDANPTVVEVAVWFFYIIPLSIGFMGMTQVASSCFNALGKPMPSLAISILRALAVYVPLAMLGNHLLGYVGIFLATAATNVLVGALAWHWNRSFVAPCRRQGGRCRGGRMNRGVVSPRSASKPTMLRPSRLKVTPTRWTSWPGRRCLAA